MTESGTEPSFHAYLQILRQRKWWIGSIIVLSLAASFAFSLTAHKQYSATAQLLVQPSVNASALDGGQEQPVTQTDVETELQLVTSASVEQAVRAQLKSTPAVSASEVGQTNVMAITATSEVPSQASQIANLYATAFVQYRQGVASHSLTTAEAQLRSQISSIGQQVKSLRNSTSAEAAALLNQEAVLKEQLAQMQVSGANDTGDVVVVAPAQTPISPSSPKPVKNALLGLAAGLALGLGAAFLRHSFDDRLTSKEATEHAAGVPVLAMTPLVTPWRRQQPLVVSVTEPTSPAAESYRSLRTSLQFARQEKQLNCLVVTSAGVSEGKTATLANLGVVFAQAGERVVLVSCDLRRPRIGSFFGLDEHEGLSSVLIGQRTLEESLLPVPDVDRLSLLPAGPIPPNPAELLNSARAQDIFARLRDQFDLVLIDSPPVLPVTDAAILSQYADATLMLAAAGQTRRSDLHRAVEKLDQVGARILGTVLNKVSRQTGRYYGYSYTYTTYSAGAHAMQQPGHLNGNSKVQNHTPR